MLCSVASRVSSSSWDSRKKVAVIDCRVQGSAWRKNRLKLGLLRLLLVVERCSGSIRILQPERLGVLEHLVEQTVIVIKAFLEQRRLVLLDELDKVK